MQLVKNLNSKVILCTLAQMNCLVMSSIVCDSGKQNFPRVCQQFMEILLLIDRETM